MLYLIGCSLALHGCHRPRPIYGRHTIAGYYDHNLGQHLGYEEIGILKSISKNSQIYLLKFSILRIIRRYYLFYIFILLHFVIGDNGKLVGFAYGIEAKRWLLELERIPLL
ncbi:MAG: MGMT family protein [Bacteroidaceae bacterium]|nr:MGMT family protein [Bacteroidaceae bacterium]